MALMMPFIFLYVGMENAFGTFVATFSVKSRLEMSNQDGAVVAAIFWGSFATSRCVVIFLSLKLKSLHLLVICQIACLVGATGLVLYGDTSITVLYTCSGHISMSMKPLPNPGVMKLLPRPRGTTFRPGPELQSVPWRH